MQIVFECMHTDLDVISHLLQYAHIHIISNLTINPSGKELCVVPIDHTTLGKFKIVQVDLAVLL